MVINLVQVGETQDLLFHAGAEVCDFIVDGCLIRVLGDPMFDFLKKASLLFQYVLE
jgi:hypothetical protein